MDKIKQDYQMRRAKILMEQAIAVDEIIKEKKRKEFNKPVSEHKFVKMVEEWAEKRGLKQK